MLLRLDGDPLRFVWAEDGGIFLEQALNDSVPGAIGTTYGGYLHLVPRLLAEVAAFAPIGFAAEVLALSAALVTALCALVVWRASEPHLPDPLLRGILAAMVLLVPVAGFETPANVTNLQWPMLFASFWLLLWRPPSRAASVAGGVFVGLTVASAPLALVLAPIAVARALRHPSRAEAGVLAGFALGAVVQLVAIAADDSTQPDPRWDWDLLPAYLVRVVGGLFLGPDLEASLWGASSIALVVAAGLTLLGVAAAALLRREARGLSILALVLSAVFFLIPGYARDAALPLMWSDDYTGAYGARYVVVPALFLLTALLLALQRAGSVLRIGALAVIAAAVLASFDVSDPARSTVRWSDTLERARFACGSVGIGVANGLPVSWPDWTIDLPCDRI